jgi:protein-tyrosine kinase
MGKMFDVLQKVQQKKTYQLLEQEEEPVKQAADDIVLDDKLVSFFQPYSVIAEQFRKLRTQIIMAGRENDLKTMMITSSMSGEGKSLVSINLAITIATELHSHALLVDCDLRNPSLSHWFGLREEKGLSDYLRGEADFQDILVNTSVERLSIISGGSIRENPAELIGSNRMKELIRDMKSRYSDRYIIFDCSPILATTEPSVINEMTDGIIFVIRAGVTQRDSVRQALKSLKKDKIMGVVLNNIDLKTKALNQRYFGTGDYRYRYDYRYPQPYPEFSLLNKSATLARDLKSLFTRFLPRRN